MSQGATSSLLFPLAVLAISVGAANAGHVGAEALPASETAQEPGASELAQELAVSSRDAVQRVQRARLAAAKLMTLVAPKWISRPNWTSDLYILNNFSEAIDLEVELLDERGELLASSVVSVGAAQHEVLEIESLLGTNGEGSLRVRYSGDEDMIQAWMVMAGPNGVAEMILKNVSADAERVLTIFWDVRRMGAAKHELKYFLVNGGDDPLRVAIRDGGQQRGRVLARELLMPGQQVVWSPLHGASTRPFGWADIEHDGAPGALAVGGWVESKNFFATLPIVTPAQRSSAAAQHAIRLPLSSGISQGVSRATVTIANTSSKSQAIVVTLIESQSGEPSAQERITIKAGEVATLDLRRLLLTLPTDLVESSMRISVRPEQPGLLLSGHSWNLMTGEAIELAFFPEDHAHGSGSYPLPDPERFDVTTTLVNLGEQASRVVGQISWTDGTFAMEPVTIPAGATRTVEFDSISGAGARDRLGRSVPLIYENGFFRWTVQGGGRDLIARTEASPRSGKDAFGFNCFGCCSEWSRGAVLPSGTTFPYYSTGALEGVEFIDTCSGTMGPYPLYNPSYFYNSPLSWNGTAVSASAPDAQDVSFSATGHRTEITLPCSEIPITIYGAGPATATKVSILDASLPANQISLRLEPASKSGNLKVYLAGTSQKTLVNTTYQSGNFTVGFGNLSGYTAGQSYDRVVAQWTVGGKTVSANLNYAFKVLGSYNHTQYNTPVSGQCTGSSVDFCYFTGDCVNVQSCSSHQVSAGPTEWIDEVEENGSGYHSQLGYISRESFCAHPIGCASTFRRVTSPCVACGGYSVAVGSTVAINQSNSDLACGSQVYVDGVGEVQVTDYGGGLSLTQLDHYVGNSGCNQATTIGQRMTFLLF